MGIRFSRRISPFPGLRFNVSRSGVSTSFGTHGAWLTLSRKRTLSFGLPGSGIRFTRSISGRAARDGAGAARSTPSRLGLLLMIAAVLAAAFAVLRLS